MMMGVGACNMVCNGLREGASGSIRERKGKVPGQFLDPAWILP